MEDFTLKNFVSMGLRLNSFSCFVHSWNVSAPPCAKTENSLILPVDEML